MVEESEFGSETEGSTPELPDRAKTPVDVKTDSAWRNPGDDPSAAGDKNTESQPPPPTISAGTGLGNSELRSVTGSQGETQTHRTPKRGRMAQIFRKAKNSLRNLGLSMATSDSKTATVARPSASGPVQSTVQGEQNEHEDDEGTTPEVSDEDTEGEDQHAAPPEVPSNYSIARDRPRRQNAGRINRDPDFDWA